MVSATVDYVHLLLYYDGYLWVRAVRMARGVAGLGRARRAHALATPAHAPYGTVVAALQQYYITLLNTRVLCTLMI